MIIFQTAKWMNILEEGGNNLSGEKQRLMLARAFYKKADIFILDEATSSVDIGQNF